MSVFFLYISSIAFFVSSVILLKKSDYISRGIKYLLLGLNASFFLLSLTEILQRIEKIENLFFIKPFLSITVSSIFGLFIYAYTLKRNLIDKEKAEEKLRLILENIPDIVYILEAKEPFRTIFISKISEKILGYTSEEIINDPHLFEKNSLNLNIKNLYSLYKKTLKDKRDVEFEYNFKTKNGQIKWLKDKAIAIKIQNENFILGIITDITREKESELKLKESEEKYRFVVENAKDFIIIVDLDGNIKYANSSTIKELEISFNELYMKNIKSFFDKNISTLIEERKRRRKQGDKSIFKYEVKLAIKNKGDILLEAVSSPIIKNEKIIGVLIIARDITERKKYEEEISIFKEVIHQSASSIIITDTDGNIEYVNPFFEKITGYSFNEVKGENPRILKSGLHNEEFYKNLWDTITSGRVWHDVFINKRKDESLYYEDAIIFPIKDKNGKIIRFSAVKQDITKQVEYEKQLIRLQRLDAIGRFTTGIAHDFNNILTAILGYSEVLERILKEDKKLQNKATSIKKAAKKAKDLIFQLLAFSRKQPLKREILNINDTIKDLSSIIREILQENIELELEFEKNLPNIYADRVQIEQIFMNLIVNSKEALEQVERKNKKITIKTKKFVMDDDFVKQHPGSIKGEYILIEIIDNGIGMDEETKSKAFEPFFTTKQCGTGLGLSTIFGIVKQNKGYITFNSEKNIGTTIKIYLPSTCKKAKAESKSDVCDGKKIKKKFKGRVLVADDDETVREVIKEFAKAIGFTVIEAKNGEEAFNKIVNDKNYDFLISDVVMPKMDGVELIKKLREKGINIKAILCSGYPLKHPELLYEEIKYAKFLPKPIEFEEFLEAIEELSNTQ